MNKGELKRINKQFYKYWMKESKEWRKNYIYSRFVFRKLFFWSEQIGKPLYEVVEEILTTDKDYIFYDDYEEINIIVGGNADATIMKKLLEIAGYEYNCASREYYLIPERKGKVLNSCYSVSLCEKCNMILNIRKKINLAFREYYYKKYSKYESRSDRISLKYMPTAYKIEPANGERLDLYSRMMSKIIILVAIVAFSAMIILSVMINENNNISNKLTTAWNTFAIASLPCFVTIMTTIFLIQHEYRVDYHRERISVLPIFSLELIDSNDLLKKGKLKKKALNIFYNTAETDDLANKNVSIYKLSNVGYGGGFNVSHDRGDQLFTFGDIMQDRCCYIAIRNMDYMYYTVNYSDIYGNKYSQFFEVVNTDGVCNVKSVPPALVMRTKRVRYQQ